MSTSRRLRGPLCALLFSFAFLACAPPRAAGQNTGTTGTIVVPAPPFIISNAPGGVTHYAKQNEKDPETAHDEWTGQDSKWDRAKKSWVDTKTGEALGFDGQLASDGTVIPAPPFITTPGKGLHEARQEKTAEYNGHGNPELAFDNTSNQILFWDREKQSWFDTKWDDGTQSRIETGPALGFNGVLVNPNATGTAQIAAPPLLPASETGVMGACPDAENCVLLQQIYLEADDRSDTAAQELIQATFDRDSDLEQAARLDKSASQQRNADISKAERQQAQGLRDKLPNAQANYDAAAKAALDAWQEWQNCLKGLLKDCPPKKHAEAKNEKNTTNMPPGNTAVTTPAVDAGTPGNSSLASDLCERAKALRDIAARDRQMADAAQDQRTKDYLLSDAKMMDGMAKEREDLARHYDPNACPEHATAIPGGNGTATPNGPGSQSAGGASTTPGLVGNGPWILIFPGLPLWNVDEQRWYGQNPDHTPRDETSQAGADTWIMIFPGLPLWNTEERRWYGYNPDHTSREDEPPINPYQNPSNSFGSPAPTGGTPTAPALQCIAGTPTVRHEGLDELIADIPLSCTGAPPPNSGIGLHSNVPLMKLDIGYKIGGQLFTDHFTPTNNGHRAQVNLPGDLSKASDFKLSLDYAPGSWDMHEHLRFRFDGSPGISVNPGGYTAPITNNQVGGFTPSSAWLDEYNRLAPFRVSNEWGESNFPRAYMNFPGYTPTSGRGMNRTPALCTDTTTTTYVPLYNGPLSSSSLGSGFGYSPFPCTLNEKRGSLTLGGSHIFRNPWTAAEDRAREFWSGRSAPNTPGGVYNSESGFQFTPGQSGGYGNDGRWGQIPQTPAGTTGLTSNGYGGVYNPSPFSYIRPQAYYDDNGPQSRFLIADPWNMRPSYCDYDFPDKLLRAAPELAQALAAEARSRQPRANRAPREAMGAHLQLVSLKRGSPTSNPSNRAGRGQLGDRRTPQVQIETRFLEVAPTFTYSIVSNGKSQGQAFELQVADPTGKVKTVAMRDGTIIEAIKPGVTEPVTAPAGRTVVKQPLNAYCLEFHKPPPAEGTLYRIADQATQEKFSSLRFLDRAAAQMSQNNQFHPDNNPEAYKNTIFQYAAWSTLEGWGQEEFTQHWVERTKENAKDLHVPWTKQMEDTLRNAAPGRWGDISAMMNQAHALEKASQERANSRQTREQQ